MATFEFTPSAANDLAALAESDHEVAAEIAFVLQEMADNPELRDRLLEEKWREDEYDIQRWLAARDASLDIFRLKVWLPPERLNGLEDPIYKRLSKYRIVYSLIPASQFVARPYTLVLACVHRREFDYGDDRENGIAQRILEELKDIL
ncbi:type II toxin-antitoxin system RelE family toxin [Spongiibacter sp. UBA1325]|uniref:type II toxin-antitoxin system RelE family toxin n=1 Tax=Spongiibacter sp. UBA1325 TaxID=1947543 RepID=UPI00257A7988|nr:hypothetical protein [Spongiibacter sp. UBA1325]|tara:strand:- start:26602 stop:27045 length:444 start_codon:yes stop_codon:yes gene_type:complete